MVGRGGVGGDDGRGAVEHGEGFAVGADDGADAVFRWRGGAIACTQAGGDGVGVAGEMNEDAVACSGAAG